MKDLECKAAIAEIASQYCDGKLARRVFLQRCGKLGLAFSAAATAGFLSPRPRPRFLRAAQARTGESGGLEEWLRDVGGGFRGSTVRMVTETTPQAR